MKSRAVAGDTKQSDRFLGEIQQIDWRRYDDCMAALGWVKALPGTTSGPLPSGGGGGAGY